MSFTRPARHRWFEFAPVLDAATKVVIDESGANQSYHFKITRAQDPSDFNVVATGDSDGKSESHLAVADLTIIGSINNDTFAITALPLANGAALTINGGGGFDAATINYTGMAATLTATGSDTLTGNDATITAIDQFTLTLGAYANTVTTLGGDDIVNLTKGGGAQNAISTGNGDDIVQYSDLRNEEPTTASGHDQIDLGAGNDYWGADYGAEQDDQIVTVTTGEVSISNGTEIRGAERFFIRTGAGDDVVNVGGDLALDRSDALRIQGWRGTDVLNFDGSVMDAPLSFGIYLIIDQYTALLVGNGVGSALLEQFEAYHVLGTKYDDSFYITDESRDLPDTIDGGVGFDTLRIGDTLALHLVVADDGSIDTDYIAGIRSIERFLIDVGDFGSTIVTSGGDDVVTGGGSLFGAGGNDTLTGLASNDILGGGAGADVLDGAGGFDTASYVDATAGVRVSLLLQQQDTRGAGTDMLRNIENLVGSAFDHVLTGTAGTNVIEGGRGNDLLDGGAGRDTVSYAAATDGVRVDLSFSGQQKTQGAGQDTLVGFEDFLGSSFDDVVIGTAGDNLLNGGAGFDTVSYAAAGRGVTIDLRIAGAQDTGFGVDRLIGVEGLVGTAFKDVLTGDYQDNRIEGGAGDDTIDGTTGFDIASYAGASAGVTVSLGPQTAQDTGGGGVDTLRNIEALSGSAFADSLTGTGQDDVLSGGGGDDRLTGLGGADLLDGDGGIDTAVYTSGAWAEYDVAAAGTGFEITRLASPDNHDLLTAIERISFEGREFDVADTVNVGPRARVDRGTDLREAGDDRPGVSTSRGDVLVNDRDANLKIEGLGEQLHVAAAGTTPGALMDLADTLTIQGRYGTLVIDDDGSYRYKLDNRLPATDHLHAGDTATERFFYEVADVHGATSVTRLTFQIAGADDAGQAPDSSPILFHPVADEGLLLIDGQMHV